MSEYINIQFQEGPIGEVGVNGCQVEDVIELLRDRLRGFLQGDFPDKYTARAVELLDTALITLNNRTADRERRGVEGKNEA